MTISASFSANSGTLALFGDDDGNQIKVERDADGTILVNGGGVPIQGGPATVAKTHLIKASGQGGNDTIALDEANGVLPRAELSGGAGNDDLTGGSGDDLLLGGNGNDALAGEKGDDIGRLGAGNDSFEWDPGDGSDVVEGGTGFDTLDFEGANVDENIDISAHGGRVRFFRDVASVTMDLNDVEQIEFDALGGVDHVTVHDLSRSETTKVAIDLGNASGHPDGKADSVDVEGTARADVIKVLGTSGAVTVSGLHAAVRIEHADAGKDALNIRAGSGNDILDAHLANGKMALGLFGERGNDTYLVANAHDRVIEAAKAGTDTVKASVGFALGDNVENLTLTGAHGIDATGNGLANTLRGNAGANHLTGGIGHDTLFGGAGADTFVFKTLGDSTASAAGRDFVQDFSHAQHDRIDLHLIDANATVSGNQAFHFIGDDAFGGQAGELRAVESGANTTISGDVNGDGAADFAITLHGHPALQNGDFFL